MSFRKEKKFRVTIGEFNRFKSELLNKGMKILHESRLINSIYFDTNEQSMFNQSEEGLLPRKKIRIRWYNENFKMTLEKKISSIEGRFKTTESLGNILDPNAIMNKSLFDSQYGSIHPILKVSYIRTYYEYHLMRITFDEQIKYKNSKDKFNRVYTDPERVIEIKVPVACDDDYIEKYIPYPTSRFSKYSRGILLSSSDLCEF
jgi:hypothetical protein